MKKKLKHITTNEWSSYLCDPIQREEIEELYNFNHTDWKVMCDTFPNFLEAVNRFWMREYEIEID